MSARPKRRGVALVAALSLMAVIGLLIGGAVATSTLASRSSRLSHDDVELTTAAEHALNSVLTDRRLADLPFARSVWFDDAPTPNAEIATRVAAMRLSGDAVWLVAEARRRDASGGMRRVNLVARWPAVGVIPDAAIVARGNLEIARGVTFSVDTSGDADCRIGTSAPDVLIPPVASVGPADSLHVFRVPSAADSASYLPGLRNPALGVVRVGGDTTLYGGAIDGVLVIEGTLTIAGPVNVSGLIVARGAIDGRFGALSLTGMALSFAGLDSTRPSVILGGGSIRHSKCVVSAALRRAIPLRPVRERSWAELF